MKVNSLKSWENLDKGLDDDSMLSEISYYTILEWRLKIY